MTYRKRDLSLNDGHILQANAYPRDAETIKFHLLYSESIGGDYEAREFQIAKGDAELIARQIFRIIAEPDTQTAWENIAEDVDEEDHDFLSMREKQLRFSALSPRRPYRPHIANSFPSRR